MILLQTEAPRLSQGKAPSFVMSVYSKHSSGDFRLAVRYDRLSTVALTYVDMLTVHEV